MPKRFLILANPIAGGGRGCPAAKDLHHALTTVGADSELFLTTQQGDAEQRAAATRKQPRYDGIVSVGGDGTLNEVLNGMPDLSVPLAMLPMGTANVLAKELELPHQPRLLARLLMAGTTRPIYVGTARSRDTGAKGQRFLLFIGVGLDGAMVQRLEQVRTGTLGKHKWAGPAWHVIRHWPRYSLEVEALDSDGKQRSLQGLTSVLITRVRNYGGVFRLPRTVLVDEPYLYVLGFRQRSRWSWIRASTRAVWGGLRPGRDVEVLRCRRVIVRASGDARSSIPPPSPDPSHEREPHGPAPFQIDGEFGGHTPVEMALDTTPIHLFCPTPQRGGMLNTP